MYISVRAGNMKIVFFGNGDRGVRCLDAVQKAGHQVAMVVAHAGESASAATFRRFAERSGIEVIAPYNPNDETTCGVLKALNPAVFVLAAYSHIVQPQLYSIPSVMSLNLHGGKLPEVRGSSPMNWALLRGFDSFTLSIIKVDRGVDTGPVLLERSFPIGANATINELHEIAYREFPEMLVELLHAIEEGVISERVQDHTRSAYFPLRFPQDGFVLWDQVTAVDLYNMIRALTDPYPCAFTFHRHRKLFLLSAERCERPYYGEPGRVYRVSERGMIVCAADEALRIRSARFEDSSLNPLEVIQRYDTLSTLKEVALDYYQNRRGDA
jgi:methionyl-tRNA formyltransferase